jgi:hypothetical protein
MASTQNYGEQLVEQGLAALQGAQHIAMSAVEGAFETAHKVLSAQRSLLGELFGGSDQAAA